MPTRFRAKFEAARLAGSPPGVAQLPRQARRFFTTVSGFEPAEFIRRLIGRTTGDVLVVGVGAGRDFFWLGLHGFRVVGLDLAFQTEVPELVIGDMARPPFATGAFDCLVLADVLEHTLEDYESLLRLGELLRPGGVLILNVPFHDDLAEYHMRAYTERTLRRMLAAAGFRITERRFRGIFPLLDTRFPPFKWLFHGVNLVTYLLFKRSLYQPLLRLITGIDWRLGRRAFLRRLSRQHGIYVRAERLDERWDFKEVNRRFFTEQKVTRSTNV